MVDPTPPQKGSVQLSKGQLVQLAKDIGFPDPELAAAIALAESAGFIDVIAAEPHGGPSYGLWQIHWSDHQQFDRKLLLRAEYNARAAFEVSKGGKNWTPWSTFKNGLHRKYMSTPPEGTPIP